MKIDNALAKRILFFPLGAARTRSLVGGFLDLKTLLTCRASPAYRESVRRIRTYRDRHMGERCFIIGNGPSLRRMDLSLLKDEYTFGLNRIYLLFDTMGFVTTYYVAVNKYVIEQCAEEISGLPCPKFINWNARRLISLSPDLMFVRSRSGPKFSVNIDTDGVWEGATVTYVAMQIAYWMGFREAILIGVDHVYRARGRPHRLVTSGGHDTDHFHPEYFGKGFRWQLPDLETSELAYKLAKSQFERSGRVILDATVGGKLQVFPKVEYAEILRGGKRLNCRCGLP